MKDTSSDEVSEATVDTATLTFAAISGSVNNWMQLCTILIIYLCVHTVESSNFENESTIKDDSSELTELLQAKQGIY